MGKEIKIVIYEDYLDHLKKAHPSDWFEFKNAYSLKEFLEETLSTLVTDGYEIKSSNYAYDRGIRGETNWFIILQREF